MAGSLNKVILIGNVGRDPEIRTTQDGREIASFSLATSEAWRDKGSGEKKEKVEWHKVVIFQPHLVGVVKNYVHKGSKIYLEGSLQTRKWTDPNGVEKYTVEVVLQPYSGTLLLLDARPNDESSFDEAKSSASSSTQEERSKPYQVEEIDDDEIPF
ncbi:MAG: single-stranded DNA-binding protein [Candidatus Midichloria sp.]|nr:single-stranded DNA-binding protein [Candidatus Midichloria sp.]MDJ1305148.1 single-stranded DNA-binding protein [Candidatus Midichloria sp.]